MPCAVLLAGGTQSFGGRRCLVTRAAGIKNVELLRILTSFERHLKNMRTTNISIFSHYPKEGQTAHID